MIWPFFLFFLQADGSGGGGGRKNRRGLTTMSLNESRGSAGGGDRGSTGGVSTYMEFFGLVVSAFTLVCPMFFFLQAPEFSGY